MPTGHTTNAWGERCEKGQVRGTTLRKPRNEPVPQRKHKTHRAGMGPSTRKRRSRAPAQDEERARRQTQTRTEGQEKEGGKQHQSTGANGAGMRGRKERPSKKCGGNKKKEGSNP